MLFPKPEEQEEHEVAVMPSSPSAPPARLHKQLSTASVFKAKADGWGKGPSKPMRFSSKSDKSGLELKERAGVVGDGGDGSDGDAVKAVGAPASKRIAKAAATRRAAFMQLAALLAWAAWIGTLIALHIAETSSLLFDPTVCALTLVLVYALVDAALNEPLFLGRYCACSMCGALGELPLTRIISMILLHVTLGCHAIIALGHSTSTGSGDAADTPAAVAALVAHYVVLWSLFFRSSVARTDHVRLRATNVALREAQLQISTMQGVISRLAGSSGVEGSWGDSESENEGDEREHLIQPPDPVVVPEELIGRPEIAISRALTKLDKHSFNRPFALKIAARLRKPTYSLARFYADVRECFHELDLYLACVEERIAGSGEEGDAPLTRTTSRRSDVTSTSVGGEMSRKPSVMGTTSGLTNDDEYRRTIGALFAIYWLMRIGIDGEKGFSFGVDDEWRKHNWGSNLIRVEPMINPS